MDDWLRIIFEELNHVVCAHIILNSSYLDFLTFAKIILKSINYFRLTMSPTKVLIIIFVHTIGLKKPPYAFCMTLLQSLAARTYYQRKV